MNVEEALSFTAALQVDFEAQSRRRRRRRRMRNDENTFGHPEIPRLALQKLSKTEEEPLATPNTTTSLADANDKNNTNSKSTFLLVSYTKHCITAQIIGKDGGEVCSPVIRVGSVQQHGNDEAYEDEDENEDMATPPERDGNNDCHEDEDETIQCLVILELEDISMCSTRITQIHNGSNEDKYFLLAVVAGTNCSRVLVSEVLVQKKKETSEWTLLCLTAQHTGGNLLEVLPRDTDAVADFIQRKTKQQQQPADSASNNNNTPVEVLVPFQPSGGVTSLFCSYDTAVGPLETRTTYVWITYKDGNIVRMHHAALFPSIWTEGSEVGVSVDDFLLQYNHTALFRCQVRLPHGVDQHLTIVPLPKYHPSPLAPVSFAGIRDVTNHREQHNHDTCYEALVFGQSPESFPTLCVYSSEDHYWEPQPTKKSDSLVALVGGALVGGVVGALRWAATGSKGGGLASESGPGGVKKVQEPPSTPFPSIWKRPVPLFAATEFHDVPRIVEHCAIDPDGQYAALADGLGRVTMFDLSTKQIIRMWKGLRQASCCWIKVPRTVGENAKAHPPRSQSFLVVHSKQRRIVEVWPPRAGNRLANFHVHRDGVILSCPDSFDNYPRQQENKSPGRECYAFVLDSVMLTGAGAATFLKEIDINSLVEQQKSQQQGQADGTYSAATGSSREATMHVQHLKQLLSSEKVMLCSKEDVLEAFCRIKSLHDLSNCLDLVAKAPLLEEELSVEGSSFQKLVLKYCSDMLQKVAKSNGGSSPQLSGGAANLTRKIDYYSRLIKAYDLLRGYESSGMKDGKTTSRPLSNFSLEACGWADVSETVTGSNMDAAVRPIDVNGYCFFQFASSCVFPSDDSSAQGMMMIYFSESTRTRQDILSFIFQPLLGWFSAGIVNSAFEALGIRNDFPYLARCFVEWFLNLKRADIEDRCLNQQDSPMIRFLQDVVESEFNMRTGPTAIDGSPGAMGSLLSLCEESTDLVRAFMVATLGREVQLRISKQKDESTFSSADMSKWYTLVKHLNSTCEDLEWLLRKIRVCLLVTLRLNGKDIAPFPLSVKNIEHEKDFSVYKLVALDELSITQRHEEIVTLEKACGLSSHRLNPFSVEADEPDKVKLLQAACIATPTDRRVADTRRPDTNGSLLLYFGAYNNPELLAAHRALLLASGWSRDPTNNPFLWRAIEALKSLPKITETVSVGYAVMLDVWTRVVAPIYRAKLFGFSDVPEIREEHVAPLLENRYWLAEFGRMALQILMLVEETLPESSETDEALPIATSDETTWPNVKDDYFLTSLMKKASRVEDSALQTHVVAVSAMLFSDDMGALTDCIPSLGDCFHPGALNRPMNKLAPKDQRQEMFLSDAIVSLAFQFTGSQLDSFRVLGELELLASHWGFDKKWLRTTFLIAMYELGKDTDVDDLMTSASSLVLPQQLIVAGVNVVCRRLDSFIIKTRSSRGAEARSVLGMLDAELCEWIHERAISSEALVGAVMVDIPIKSTHILTIRLLSLGSTSNSDQGIRTRIHALSVLCGTLLKTREGQFAR